MSDGGERHAQVEYRAAFDGLRRFFAGRGVPSEEAADLAQEALTRTFVHIKRHGRASEDLWPLLTTVARNLYSDRGRRNTPAYVPLTEAVELADADPTPDDVVLRRERRDSVRAAVASLPARHRRAIELELRGLTPADIARELGIKRNAADALLHRARRSLASKLESMRGAFGALPFVLRIKTLARRTSDAISRVDPTGAFAGAATSLAAVALVGALGGGHAVQHNPGPAALFATGSHAASNTGTGAGHIIGAPSSASGAKASTSAMVITQFDRSSVSARLRAQNPTDPTDNSIGFGFVEKPDGRPSMIGDVFNRTAAEVCSGQSQVCSTSGGH